MMDVAGHHGVCRSRTVQVMPVLREISASCGIALRVDPAHWEAAQAALAACELKPEEYAFYAVTAGSHALQVRPVMGPDT